MKNLFEKLFKWQWLACLAVGCCFVSCSDDDDSTSSSYDPSKPLTLTDFYPTDGKLATQVILNGSNFGNVASDITVYFNDKQAAVISAKDDKMLVLAPKRAASTEDPSCVITVSIGDQTAEYEDTFNYTIQTNVTTVVGGTTSASSYSTGTVTLSEAQFSNSIERNVYVDEDDNIFFVMDNGDGFSAYMANEEADQLKLLDDTFTNFLTGFFIGYDYFNNRVHGFYTNIGYYNMGYFDPTSDYGWVDNGSFTNISSDDLPLITGWSIWSGYANFSMGPDGKFYCRALMGYLIRIDPNTNVGEILNDGNAYLDDTENGSGTCRGLIFDPYDDDVMYLSNTDTHCIYRYDMSTGEVDVYAGQSGKSGYLDGPMAQALFSTPSQMVFDSEDNIILCDTGNHCIRKINTTTGYVSTVAGLPQSSGYTNGSSDVAQFNSPIGICINDEDVMYVGDSSNRAIRRLAVE